MPEKGHIDRGSELTFVRHRTQLDVYTHALTSGLTDADYVALVTELDSRIVAASGVGFAITPLVELDLPLKRRVVGKVETGNVSGSHKARHLVGLLLWLRIDERAGKKRPDELAIASCGNAALGAATIAQAVGRELRVFVPSEADPLVLTELERLGSTVQVCPRQPDQVGDPCMAELDMAIRSGSEAFTVQGPTSPNVIDGGRTLGLELAEQVLGHMKDLTPLICMCKLVGEPLAQPPWTVSFGGVSRCGCTRYSHKMPIRTSPCGTGCGNALARTAFRRAVDRSRWPLRHCVN